MKLFLIYFRESWMISCKVVKAKTQELAEAKFLAKLDKKILDVVEAEVLE